MALTTVAVNSMLDALVVNFKRVYVVTGSLSAIDGTISGYPDARFGGYPESFLLAWGSASGGEISTTNSIATTNPINYSVKSSAILTSIMIGNNVTNKTGTNVGMIDLGSVLDASGDWPYFLRGLKITLGEVVVV